MCTIIEIRNRLNHSNIEQWKWLRFTFTLILYEGRIIPMTP